MRTAFRRLALLSLSGLIAQVNAADTVAPANGDVIAQAGSTAIGSAEVRSLIAALPASEHGAIVGNLNNLEQVVRAELVRRAVLAEAKSKGFDRQPETLLQLDKLRDEALVRLWVASRAAMPVGYPSESDVKTAYDAYKQALAPATEYHLAQIFIAAPDGGDPARMGAALKKAADIGSRAATVDFAKLAQEQSENTDSAAKGGDMGYLPENRMLPEIASVARGMKPGEVVGPVKTAQGLHFLKLLDKKVGTLPTLAQAHDDLVTILRTRRAQELQQAYLTDLNGTLGITVNQIALAKLQQSLK